MKLRNLVIKHLCKHWLFLITIPFLTLLQFYMLIPHLQYGLTDLDDGYIYLFRILREKEPNIFNFFLASSEWGLYTHQFYYVGLLNYLFKDNFVLYHLVTHTFKAISTIALYPLFYFLSGSRLIALGSAVFFGLSFVSAGSVGEGVIHGSVFPAIAMLAIFLLIYFYLIKNNVFQPRLTLIALLFLLSSLAISTSRIFGIPAFILIVELLLFLKNRSKTTLLNSIKRAGFLLTPVILMILYKPSVITVMLDPAISKIVEIFSTNRLDKLLTPIIVLGSLFVPDRYFQVLKIYQSDEFNLFFSKILEITPLFFITTFLVALILAKRKAIFVLITVLTTTLGVFATYLLSLGNPSAAVTDSLVGFYIIGLALAFLTEWFYSRRQEYIGLFLGPFAGLFFILIMWTGTGEKDLVFTGATRYNTLAAIFTSFFLGSIFACCIKRLWEKSLYFKIFASVPFSLMIFLLYINIPETNAYFQHKLRLGYDYSDQLYIRKQLIPYYKDPDSDNRKLIYLDFSEMKEDEMYYRDVIFSSANVWPLWFLGENAKPEFFPELNHNFGDIKSSVVTLDGKQIIRYKGIIYKTENFYTLKLKDKKFIDISGEIRQKLEL